MIILGCLIALAAVVAPRVILVLAWLFADRWVLVWQGDVVAPLLGILFLPYTTIIYLLVWQPEGIVGFAWLWLLLGVLLDIMKWGQVLTNRKAGTEYAKRYYGAIAPGESTGPSGTAAKDDDPGE